MAQAWRDTRPPYLRYAATIRAEILAGDFADKLPSVKEFMGRYATNSTSVIQRALEVLEAEGLVERKHGSGNFARGGKVVVIDATPDVDPDVKYKVHRVDEVVPPTDVRVELGIGPADTAIVREQVGRRDGEPVEYVRNFYRHELADGTRIAEFAPVIGGVKKFLASEGHRGATMTDVEMVRMPTEKEVVPLELPEGVPVFSVLRAIRDERGFPIEVSVIVKGGHRYALRHGADLR